ncbi:hypothetical protein YT1_0249 [Rhodococcus ruber]|nr:hypothetical protein YT1_0249 [Rhodococcus ruber]CCW11903.1 hypothetical protein EBESD8_24470 [Rhodococcus aetherivorans]
MLRLTLDHGGGADAPPPSGSQPRVIWPYRKIELRADQPRFLPAM